MSRRQLRIIIAGPAGSRSYGLRLSRGGFWLAAAAGALLLAGLVFMLITYGRLAAVAEKARTLERDNRALQRQGGRVADLKAEVDRLRRFEARMLALMGVDTLDVARARYAEAWQDSAATDSLLGGERAQGFLWPVRGEISRGYLPRREARRRHLGLDIVAPPGAPVRAARDGKVTFAGRDSVFGNLVSLDHGNGLTTVYGHNSELLVKIGDTVRRGDVIALVGSTGRSSAPHLHFEVREGDEAVDPLNYLERRR